MIRTTILVIAALMIGTANVWSQAEQQINRVLNEIEQNNTRLQSLRLGHEADMLEFRSQNQLAAPSVEYSPFWQKGYKGIASSELIVSETFDFPTIYGQRRKQQRLQQTLLDDTYAIARREVLLQAHLLCIDIIRQNQIAGMLKTRLEQAEGMLRLFEKRMEAGDATALELNKAKLERMEVMKDVAQAENERERLRLELQMMNGEVPIEMEEMEFPEYIQTEGEEALMSETLRLDPRVRIADSQYELNEQLVKMSKMSWLPQLTVGFRQNTEMRERLNGFVVGASFPLFGNRNQVRAARQRQEAEMKAMQEEKNKVQTEYSIRQKEMERLRKLMDHSDTRLLRETLQLLDNAMQHGELTALQYYQEQRDIYDQLASHIDLHHQYARLTAEQMQGYSK